jgi:hypothetical protein
VSRKLDEDDQGCLLIAAIAVFSGTAMAVLTWVVVNAAAGMGAG